MPDNSQTRLAAARAFVRSLNILLKFARMYDFGHPRTAKQYETAWTELRTALGGDESGVLLAVSGDQLLLDGTPLESAAAEKSFARMLSGAGIASIFFSAKVTQASLARFVKGFPTSQGSKPAQLAEQLKAALQGDPNIHVNEVCFVPADSAVAKTTVAAQLAARTLGMTSGQTEELFNDPEKLLQLIVAAEGTKSGPGGPGPGGGEGQGGGHGSGSGGSGGGFGFGSGPTGSGGGYSGRGYTGEGSGGGQEGIAGEGPGGGSGSGGPGGGFGPGSGPGGTGYPGGGYSGGPGNYYSGSSEPTQPGSETPGVAFASGGSSAEGPVALIQGGGPGSGVSGAPSGGWNIVGGTGGGTPIDPNAGGFWLTKDGSGNSANSGGIGAGVGSGGPGSVLSGGGAPVGSSGTSDGGAGGAGGSGGFASAGGGSASPSGGAGSNVPPSALGSRIWKFASGGEPQATPPSRWANATSDIRGSRPTRGSRAGSMTVETGLMTLQEDELQGILQVLAQIARTSETSKDKIDPQAFQSRLSTLPRRARFTVSQALSALAAQGGPEEATKPTLMKLAEHIAVRFALESYERGDVKVNTVRQMLDEMNTELDGLRKILGVYEERMTRAGIPVQSHVEVLAREFWSQVPDDKRKSVLESADAWCVPPAKVRDYVEGLIARKETEEAERILQNYLKGIKNKNSEARRQTATGLAELAAAYARMDQKFFVETIREVGLQLAEEKEPELQSQMSAAFVRLSQEAAKSRSYPALQRSVELVDYVESERPGAGKSLRPRVGVENRLPEFIDEALRLGEVPNGLTDLLRRLPQASSQQIAGRFSRVGFRRDCDLLVSMMESLGPEALEHLRVQLREGTPNEAIDTVGILARLDLETLEQVLPGRMKEWKRMAHDRVVRQIAASGAPGRGRVLLELFDMLDVLIRPLAVDEIGMAGEKSAEMRLLRIAEGDLPKGSTDYVRLKAIEALGRLRTAGGETILRKVAEAKKRWRWANPGELRLVAAQALEKIDPEWMRYFIPQSGLSVADLSMNILDGDPESQAIRQRRYPRLRLEQPMFATTVNLKENCEMQIPEMALGGGVAICEQTLHPGSVVEMRMQGGQKTIKAQTIIRDANTQARAFEVVDIEIEERGKLRKVLIQVGSVQKQSTAQERSRRTTRTFLIGSGTGTTNTSGNSNS